MRTEQKPYRVEDTLRTYRKHGAGRYRGKPADVRRVEAQVNAIRGGIGRRNDRGECGGKANQIDRDAGDTVA